MDAFLFFAVICIVITFVACRDKIGFFESVKDKSVAERLKQIKVVGEDEKQPAKDINFLMEVRKLELLSAIKNIGLFFLCLTLFSIIVWIIYFLITTSM